MFAVERRHSSAGYSNTVCVGVGKGRLENEDRELKAEK